MKLLKKYLRKWLLKDCDYCTKQPLNLIVNKFEVEKIEVESFLPVDVPQQSIDKRLTLELLYRIEKHIKTETFVCTFNHTIFAKNRIKKTIYIAKEN